MSKKYYENWKLISVLLFCFTWLGVLCVCFVSRCLTKQLLTDFIIDLEMYFLKLHLITCGLTFLDESWYDASLPPMILLNWFDFITLYSLIKLIMLHKEFHAFYVE